MLRPLQFSWLTACLVLSCPTMAPAAPEPDCVVVFNELLYCTPTYPGP